MYLPSLPALVAAILIPVLAGCGRSGKSTGPGSAYQNFAGTSLSWNEKSPNPVGGIDHARVEYAKYGDQLSILLWTDLKIGGATTSSIDKSDGASFKGSFLSSDLKKPIDFHYQEQSPNSGSLTIDAITYDLANGSLFLISNTGERPVVKQLKLDTTQLKVDAASLRALAKSDAEISAFFASPVQAQRAP